MTPEVKRRFNTVAGSFFIGLGLFAWGLTAFYAVKPKAEAPVPITAALVDVNSCRTTLMRMGYQARSTAGQEIQAVETTIVDAESQLLKATAAVGACRLQMKRFCMGRGCEQPGITFTLDGAQGRQGAKPSP